MPRIRTLKPEHRQHRKVGPLDNFTYRLWVGMILEADDEGRLVADPSSLRSQIFPYTPRTSLSRISDALSRLNSVRLCLLYSADGTQYAWFPSWHDHQRINKPQRSRLPAYPDSGNAPGTLPDKYGSIPVGSGSGSEVERKGTERKGGESEGREPAFVNLQTRRDQLLRERGYKP